MIFEQVFAALDYEIFRKVMTKRNIMIQEQVLLMIIAATGQLPASMQFEVIKAGGDKQEEQVLKQAMRLVIDKFVSNTKAVIFYLLFDGPSSSRFLKIQIKIKNRFHVFFVFTNPEFHSELFFVLLFANCGL